MKTISKEICVVVKKPIKFSRDLFRVKVDYTRDGEECTEECLTADETLRVGDECILRIIEIIENEVSIVEKKGKPEASHTFYHNVSQAT